MGQEGKRGFTLIEVMIVVLIISIIASIAIPNFLSALHRSRQRRTMMDMRSLSTAVESYKIDFSTPPQVPDVPTLVALIQPLYIAQLPQQDGWGNDITYTSGGEAYTLESYGRDGADGANITPQTKDQYDLDIVLFDGIFVATPD
jgi:general secretion pathway protein G